MNRHTINEIENKYKVESITVNDIQFWPFIRNYIASQIHFKKDRKVSPNFNKSLYLLKSLFYGVFNFLKKSDIIYMSSSDQRREIDNLYMDRMDFVIDYLQDKNYILIEQPNPKHYKKSKIKTQNISSKTVFYLMEFFLSKVIRVKSQNIDILQQIISEYQLDINIKNYAKLFYAQYLVSDFFFRLKRNKYFMLTVPYINCARVFAAKKNRICVIEFQHGTISENHYAYNISKYINSKFYPDYLLTFGGQEKNVFSSDNYYIEQDKVYPIGSFYINNIIENGVNSSEFFAIKTKFKKVIAFSCQDEMEDLWIPFFCEIAEEYNDYAFILMPRHKGESYYRKFSFSKNVFFISSLNTYEIIYLSDIHSTINSTTAIESLSLGTPNILLNIDNLAKKYYQNVLKNYTYFISTVDDFGNCVVQMKYSGKNDIIESNFNNIAPNFSANLRKVLNEIIQ